METKCETKWGDRVGDRWETDGRQMGDRDHGKYSGRSIVGDKAGNKVKDKLVDTKTETCWETKQ